jgi:hypothetical protein
MSTRTMSSAGICISVSLTTTPYMQPLGCVFATGHACSTSNQMARGYVATSLPRRPASYLVPPVTEQTSRGERSFDLYLGLLLNRVVFLGPKVDDTKAHLIIDQLIQLDSQDPDPEIKLYINSPGGSVTVGLGIHDTRY